MPSPRPAAGDSRVQQHALAGMIAACGNLRGVWRSLASGLRGRPVPGERTIMPSPARARRGWRAGIRAQSRWLDAAVSTAALGLALGAMPWSLASGFGARWQGAIARPERIPGLLGDVAEAALFVLVVLVLAFGVGRVLSASISGRLGPVERRGLARLGVGPASAQVGPRIALAVGAVLAVLWAVRGVVAAAARGVDASPAAAVQLWTTWPHRGWAACVVVLAVFGWGELMLSRRRNRLRLAQTPAQVRDELRLQGGGRR